VDVQKEDRWKCSGWRPDDCCEHASVCSPPPRLELDIYHLFVSRVSCLEANQKVNMDRGGCSERGQMKKGTWTPWWMFRMRTHEASPGGVCCEHASVCSPSTVPRIRHPSSPRLQGQLPVAVPPLPPLSRCSLARSCLGRPVCIASFAWQLPPLSQTC